MSICHSIKTRVRLSPLNCAHCVLKAVPECSPGSKFIEVLIYSEQMCCDLLTCVMLEMIGSSCARSCIDRRAYLRAREKNSESLRLPFNCP